MPPLLKRDVRLGEGVNLQRWAVVKRIGDGGFAEVYEVNDTFQDDKKFAVKIDKMDKRKDPRGGTVKAEIKVLRQLQSCPPVCRLVPEGEGTHEGRFYMIMELLGANLAQFQHSSPHGRVKPDVAKSIALDMLAALEGVHRAGYIHRDVKPANFAQSLGSGGKSSGGQWRIIDFGIARRFVDDAGRPLPKREDFGEFRGSTTYASIHAHLKQDLGRRDDLWSWLYIIVEMLEGNLPWRAASGDASAGSEHSPKEVAMRLKEHALDDPNVLSASVKLPEALAAISSYLRSISFADEPNYRLLRDCINSLPSTPTPEPVPLRPAPLANGHATPPAQQQQHIPGHMWHHMAPTSAPVPMYANGGPYTGPMSHGSFAYPHMQAHGGYYGWPYTAQPQHGGHPQMAMGYMQGYAATQPPAPITLSAPSVPWQHTPQNSRAPQPQAPQPATSAPPASGPAPSGQPAGTSAAQIGEFDVEDQLGQIGSAFDDDGDFDFGLAARPLSNSRAAKRPLAAGEEPPDEAQMSKRVRFSPTVNVRWLEPEPSLEERAAARAATGRPLSNGQREVWQKLAAAAGNRSRDQLRRRGRGVAVGALADMQKMAAVVGRGQLSKDAKEAKDKVRRLDPAEGIGIIAWLVDSVSRHADPKGTSQVVQWLGSLAAFCDECATRCEAIRASQ